jgi:hypothetical protein
LEENKNYKKKVEKRFIGRKILLYAVTKPGEKNLNFILQRSKK